MNSLLSRLPCSWMVVIINVGSNLAGFFLVQVLLIYAHPSEQWRGLSLLDQETNVALLSFLVPVAILILIKLAEPVAKVVRSLKRGETVSDKALTAARRRAVNLPFQAAAMNLAAWVLPAVTFPLVFGAAKVQSPLTIATSALYSFSNAVMITLLAFILLEHACRRTIIPVLFPKGGIHEQKGTIILNIRHRLMVMYAAVCFIPMVQVALVINANASHPATKVDPATALKDLATFAFILFVFAAIYGVWLAVLISRDLAEPAREIMQVTDRVRQGDYDCRAKVLTNDEIGYLGDRINEMTRGLKEREEIRKVFNLFTSPEISREVLSRGTLEGGETRNVTLLFSDLRGFTAMAERMPPEQVLESINDYFNEMSAAIVAQGGIVLQYVGDEIEAVFGAPHHDPRHADNAVAAALEMRARLSLLNEKRAARGQEPLRHGVGIHTGIALAGIVGSRYKISYAMVGDTVNVASRIQDLTKEMDSDILMSDETYRSLSVPVEVSGPVTVEVKGKKKRVEVLELIR